MEYWNSPKTFPVLTVNVTDTRRKTLRPGVTLNPGNFLDLQALEQISLLLLKLIQRRAFKTTFGKLMPTPSDIGDLQISNSIRV